MNRVAIKKSRKSGRVRLLPKALHLALAAALSTAWTIPAALAQGTSGTGSGLSASTIAEQPNLMILLSNSASMSLNMAGTNLATAPTGSANKGLPLMNQCPANYKSSSDYYPVPTFNDGACGGSGTVFPWAEYGNQPDSRFYIAKQALYNVLQQPYAQHINLGFATYRQAFGLQASTVSQSSNALYTNVYLPGQAAGAPGIFPSPYSGYTPTQLAAVGNDPTNFAFVSWWPVYNSQYTGQNGDANAFLGKGLNGSPGGVNGASPFNSANLFANNLSYLNNNSGVGGLPQTVQYPIGTEQNYTITNNRSYYYGSYYGPAGLAPGQKTQPVLRLCQTYYNSQANNFQAIYTENASNGDPILFQQTFPSEYNGNTLYYVTLGSPLFQNRSIPANSYSQSCNVAGGPSSVTIGQGNTLVSDQWTGGGNAYFSYIPNWYSGTANDGNNTLNLNPGQADGWSGATTSDSAGNVTASYPTSPQSESILGKWNWSGAKWMGVFVNLPSSSNVVNNAPVIANLVNPAYPMESQSGLDYSYSKQAITSSSGSPRSIANSSMSASYNQSQEPLYDSLVDAYAYWQAFESKVQSGTASCYHNNMLVIFDGISDGHKGYTAAQEQAALIKEAQALYKNLGVKIYVIIISNNQGDIEQANALAAAGGTGSAFQVQSANQLAAALQTTFIGVAGESLVSSFSTPPTIQSGDYAFAPLSVSQVGGQGDLVAYQVLANGQLNSTSSLTPSWDAESLLSKKGIPVYSTSINNPASFQSGENELLTSLATSANASTIFQTSSSTPSPTTIAAYTVNPSYDSGKYLGGRTINWFVGLPSGSKPVVVTPPYNPQLLSAPGYVGFAQGAASRQNTVLYTGNDGLLTAIGYRNGNNPNPSLLWSWMPSGLLPQLQNYDSFWRGPNMAGGFTELDSNGGSSTSPAWASYVVGLADNGQIIYDLKMSGQKTLKLGSTVAEYDLGSLQNQYGVIPTTGGAPALYWNSAGQGYAAWSLSYTSGSTTTTGIFLLNVSSGNNAFITVPSSGPNLTSMPIFGDNGNLYVGAGSKILELPQSALADYMSKKMNKKVPNSISGSWTVLSSGSGSGSSSNMMPFTGDADTNIQWLQESYAQGSYWLTAESSNGITAIQQSNGAWVPQWYSATTGAGRLSNGTMTPQSANNPSSTAIPTIPSNGTVTDAALVVGGAVYLPVSVPPTGDACGLTSAYYYLFKLQNGAYPSGLVTNLDGTAVTGPLAIGAGKALTPTLSLLNGRPIIQSAASNTNASKTFPATTSAGLPLGGPVAWRLVLTQ